MKDGVKVGLTGEHRAIVEPRHLVDFMGEPTPGVLATAWLVWFMEHASRNAILSFMEDDEDSVGTSVEIEHSAPTPVGHEVVCTSRVIHVDGKSITFDVQARDEREAIGRAVHKRFVVTKSRFARTIERKRKD